MNAVRLMMLTMMAAALALLGGCGGDQGDLFDGELSGYGTITSSDTENEDGSHSDFVSFVANQTGVILAAMARQGNDPVYDPYIVIREDVGGEPGNVITFNDDGSADSRDSLVSFVAQRGVRYWVQLTTLDPDDFGSYYYLIQESNDSFDRSQEPNQSKRDDVDKTPKSQ